MRTVILAGGLGTRLAEETEVKPKPMVEIGPRPIIWHIMKHFETHGFKEFTIALGYKGDVIKNYFMNYHAMMNDVTIDTASGKVSGRKGRVEDWRLHLMNTGALTNTGGRILRLRDHLDGERFFVTYGDGVSNVDLRKLLKFHIAQKKLATITAVRPPARFGGIRFGRADKVSFTEKPQGGEGWINGGFMVFEPTIFDHIPADATSLEAETLQGLAREGELAAYRHNDFWQCIDTLRDVQLLQTLWKEGRPPWKTWE